MRPKGQVGSAVFPACLDVRLACAHSLPNSPPDCLPSRSCPLRVRVPLFRIPNKNTTRLGGIFVWCARRDKSAPPSFLLVSTFVSPAHTRCQTVHRTVCLHARALSGFESLYLEFQTKIPPAWVVFLFGAPEGTRTPDLLVRSQSLYPAELRAHVLLSNTTDILPYFQAFVKSFFTFF